GADERVHHTLSRVQAMLGHGGVLTPAVGGGRWLAERQVLVPWGDRVVVAAERGCPWPGSLTAPLPGTVFEPPRPAEVRDAAGTPVTIDDRGRLSAAPAVLVPRQAREPRQARAPRQAREPRQGRAPRQAREPGQARAPRQAREPGKGCAIEAWAGPWPVSERGWDAARARRAHRFQLVDAD